MRNPVSQSAARSTILVICLFFWIGVVPASNASKPTPSEESIQLISGGGAQLEIVCPSGIRIFTDVSDPDLLSSPPTARDILLTTHFDDDHFDQAFIDGFPGQHLHSKQGRITRPGLTIKSIAAHHSEQTWKTMDPSAGSNFLFVIETAGIRIAHFGDIGQPEFSKGQRQALGRVDVAITQFINLYSQMDLTNQKGFHLMNALQPKLILGHHGGTADGTIKLALKQWKVMCELSDRITLRLEALPKETTYLVWGDMADYLMRTFQLSPWKSRF